MKTSTMLAATLLLAACSHTEYIYTPPETPEGKACVERCQAKQTTCRKDQDLKAEKQVARCEDEAHRREMMCNVRAPIDYASCIKLAKTDGERAACRLEDCTQPACQAAPTYGICENDFRICYQSCGGTIRAIEE